MPPLPRLLLLFRASAAQVDLDFLNIASARYRRHNSKPRVTQTAIGTTMTINMFRLDNLLPLPGIPEVIEALTKGVALGNNATGRAEGFQLGV